MDRFLRVEKKQARTGRDEPGRYKTKFPRKESSGPRENHFDLDANETMTSTEHTKIVAIGYAAFAAIFFFTFLLLLFVSVGVFVALGITFANETGDPKQAGIGILGGIFTVIFYGVLGVICVLPPALASWKMLKRRPRARFWGIIAAIVLLPILPLGTMLGVYGLWFFFGPVGRTLRS